MARRIEVNGYWIKDYLLTDVGPIKIEADAKIMLQRDQIYNPDLLEKIRIGRTVADHMKCSSLSTLRLLIEEGYVRIEFPD